MKSTEQFAWASERYSIGAKLHVTIKEESGKENISGILMEMDRSGLILETLSDPPLEMIPFSIVESMKIDKEDCTHRYCDGRGAVEPIGFPIRGLRSKKIVEYQVATEDDAEVGYCLICGSKQPANVPLEQTVRYQEAVKEYEQQTEEGDD